MTGPDRHDIELIETPENVIASPIVDLFHVL